MSTKVGWVACGAFAGGHEKREGFARRFWIISNRLGLRGALNEAEMTLLYHAAYTGTLCHIAFNGLGGCGGQIRPERELNRIALEQGFARVREGLMTSAGWRGLSASMREAVEQIFLRAFVEDEHLRG